RKTIQTLAECHCRWPIGDPQSADFHFCGKEKVAGLPYCQFNARRAYQPPQSKRREPVEAPMTTLVKTEQSQTADA
ncbi:MAG: GcrA family cell cycle regulator, partial [Hyphomicrobiaceae bacterium]